MYAIILGAHLARLNCAQQHSLGLLRVHTPHPSLLTYARQVRTIVDRNAFPSSKAVTARQDRFTLPLPRDGMLALMPTTRHQPSRYPLHSRPHCPAPVAHLIQAGTRSNHHPPGCCSRILTRLPFGMAGLPEGSARAPGESAAHGMDVQWSPHPTLG